MVIDALRNRTEANSVAISTLTDLHDLIGTAVRSIASQAYYRKGDRF